MSQTEATHAESIEGREPDPDAQKKAKSRRPATLTTRYRFPTAEIEGLAVSDLPYPCFNVPITSKTYTAKRPILTPKTVLPLFFIIGIIFAPIGALLLYASAQVEEIVIDYTDCIKLAPESNETVGLAPIPGSRVSSSFKPSKTCPRGGEPQWKRNKTIATYRNYRQPEPADLCTIQFPVPNNLDPPVFFYYRLTNFYQNHRRYVKSRDSNQLKGEAVSNHTIAGGECDPLRIDGRGRPYYPCGLIANSQFNDTFLQPVLLNVQNGTMGNQTYNMTNKGIAWDSDKELYGKTKYKYEDIAVPPNWVKQYPPEGYSAEHPPPNLKEDEEFQVWMRTAGLPAFSKLAMKNEIEHMACGNYQVDIIMNFNVSVYGGTKSIVLSTATVMGGKNPFLGIAYVVVAGICIVLGALFTVTHLVKPRPVFSITTILGHGHHAQNVSLTRCDAPQPNKALDAFHKEMHARNKLHKLQPRALPTYKVDTWFHYVVTEDQAPFYTPEVRADKADDQLSVLNAAFAPAGISFRLNPPSFTIRDEWATDARDKEMRTALRAGGYASLNIYFQSNLSSAGPSSGGTTPLSPTPQFLLGYCSMPSSSSTTTCTSNKAGGTSCTSRAAPPTAFADDGCSVLAASMPGGALEDYDEGKTAVHEVGHWFGLKHTFDGYSCAEGDEGDYIADTPQEGTQTDGCP
ncbi:MAG: hypothetical protein Q9214_002849, partial [Letrouitia sp. 1 TL-2023]